MSKNFKITCKGSECELCIYDVIDMYGVSAKAVREELKAAGKISTIHVRLNSVGGSLFEGLGIYNTLKLHPARVIVHVDGIALSMASLVAMAGDEIEMAQNAFMMIHNPVNVTFGEAEDMRAAAELLDKMKCQLVATYAARSRQTPEKISSMMDAETWLDAEECCAMGFADRRCEALAVAAAFDASRFTNVPKILLKGETPVPETQATTPPAAPAAPVAATFTELKAALAGADAAFLCSQLEANATLPQAQSAWMAEQGNRLEAAKKEAADLKAAADAGKKKHGVDTLGDATNGKPAASGNGDAVAAWFAAIDAKMITAKDRGKAIRAVVKEQPELHREYLEAVNAR